MICVIMVLGQKLCCLVQRDGFWGVVGRRGEEGGLILRGGSNFISSASRHGGTGGNSKLRRPPQAMAAAAAHARDVLARMQAAGEEVDRVGPIEGGVAPDGVVVAVIGGDGVPQGISGAVNIGARVNRPEREAEAPEPQGGLEAEAGHVVAIAQHNGGYPMLGEQGGEGQMLGRGPAIIGNAEIAPAVAYPEPIVINQHLEDREDDANELRNNPFAMRSFRGRVEQSSVIRGYEDDVVLEHSRFLDSDEGCERICKDARDLRKRNYIHSDFANVKSLHDSPDFENKIVVDCYGAPFCGLTVIDVACKIKPDIDSYERFCPGACDDEAIIDAVGTSDFLIQYGAYRRMNVRIRSAAGVVQPDNPVPGWKWVLIDHIGDGCGHYRLLVEHISSGNNLSPPVPVRQPTGFWGTVKKVAAGVGLALLIAHPFVSVPLLSTIAVKCIGAAACATIKTVAATTAMAAEVIEINPVYVAGPIIAQSDDTDRRPVIDRRDPIVLQDTYSEVTKHYSVCVWWGGWVEILNSSELFGYHRSWLVSVVRSNQLFSEMQALAVSGRDPSLALVGIGRLREVNTDSGLTNVLFNTADYLNDIKFSIKVGQFSVRTPGLVAYNADPRALAPMNLVAVAENQLVGGKMGKTNYVKKAVLTSVKSKVPIAVAPVGCVVTNDGPLEPGLFCVTDACSTFSAVVGRGMVKDMAVTELLSDFVDYSVGFLKPFIDSTPIPGPEREVTEYYSERNQCKKRAVDIKSDIEDYNRFRDGQMTMKEVNKYQQGKVFVKFESNVKEHEGEFYAKPRAIMMMSPRATMELNQLCTVFDCWNDGPFGRFQVKHMSQDEVVDKVVRMTDRAHSVTDFSSFESSILDAVREIERYAMRSLLVRCGYAETLRNYNDFENRGFDLAYTPSCFCFTSRCSGHYWTSFANGVVNVCLAAYVSHVNGVPLSIIAEGDDGIVPSEGLDSGLTARLGFKLSSEMSGTRPGDNDFLRSRWMDGKRYLNVGRVIAGCFWVKQGARLRIGKQKFILRCMAMSIWNMSPGHPVLWAYCARVFALTNGCKDFKGSHRYLNFWGIGKEESYRPIKDLIQVDEKMRANVASGGNGFPGITIEEQLWLEERLLDLSDPDVYLGRLLDDYDDIRNNKGAAVTSSKLHKGIENFIQAVQAVNDPMKLIRLENLRTKFPGAAYLLAVDRDGELCAAATRHILSRTGCVELRGGWDSVFDWVEPANPTCFNRSG